ncbi:hypothetical protein F3J23_06705 [Chryseobacterium sp. Tr-659]|uniref:hypothetical protein n=1 Tax=Chryseobacterium sp. Tr-659 TaxID=2608340 RepID=UPI00141F5F37|nr:hypothetical protein [Chryseobacterium sp. Tr-659]NIF05129.1 hypothetical protein [Chryseobacterium sp. Tr-659]
MGSLSSSFFFLYHNLFCASKSYFATGHFWGEDMTNVNAYFLKGSFKVIAPVQMEEIILIIDLLTTISSCYGLV